MRTKTLLLTAAVTAAGIATSMAQVYSVNSVGYIKVNVQPGFQMIANQLDAGDNTVGALLPSGFENGTTIYKFDPDAGSYAINSFLFGSWSEPDMTLNPGEGAFFLNPGAEAITLTFVGEVPQGDLTQDIPAGFSIQSSQVPQAGGLDTDLEFPAASGDTVYRFDPDAQGYDVHSVVFGSWTPSEPVVEVGESVFVSKDAATSWDRTFSVNQ